MEPVRTVRDKITFVGMFKEELTGMDWERGNEIRLLGPHIEIPVDLVPGKYVVTMELLEPEEGQIEEN